MCVSCGTIGLDKEGRLISCSQCGQSYHPYCVGFTKMVCCFSSINDRFDFLVSSRRLFSTRVGVAWIARRVSVAVKQPMKESSSYAMIAISRIIPTVCHHHWITYRKAIGSVNGRVVRRRVGRRAMPCRLSRCVHCLKCGSTSPGQDCQWENNYTECGPCYSSSTCPLCVRKYRPDELIIQCGKCNRWCHSMCANIFTEEMAERKCQEQSFLCLLCQPDQSTLILMRYSSTNSLHDQQITPNKSVKFDEGVYLTDNGMAQLKAIRPKITQAARKPKQPVQKNPHLFKRSDSIGINDEERSDDEKTHLNNEPQTKKPAIRKYTGKNRTIQGRNSFRVHTS